MGQAAVGLTLYGSPEARALELDATIASTRARLGALLGELDRRRRAAMDVSAQLRKNAKLLVVGAAGVTLLAGVFIGLRAARNRRLSRPIERVRRLGRAVSRMARDPDRVAAPPPDLLPKLLMAMATTAATTLVASAVKRTLENALLPPARAAALELRTMLPAAPNEVEPLSK